MFRETQFTERRGPVVSFVCDRSRVQISSQRPAIVTEVCGFPQFLHVNVGIVLLPRPLQCIIQPHSFHSALYGPSYRVASLNKVKLKQSRYTPWRRLGGEEL
jgi:hypothetical protein